MGGIKELKAELTEMNANIAELAKELHETNITIRESLQLTSDTIKEMTESFSKALKDAMEKVSDMSIQMNVKDSILKSLGINGLVPDFWKKKK
jgi:phosphoribosyl-dephospho-CoA transferase